jgi:hypothetical protein
MELIRLNFDKIKESNNPEAINDFLISLSEDPKEEYLNFLDYFINEAEERIYEKVKLNLIFVLGEIGKLTKVSDKYLQKLRDIYFTSDRWVRYEIIQAINKISKQTKLSDKILALLGNALNDDYLPVKKSVLEILKILEFLPNSILIQIFRVLNSKDSEVLDLCRQVLERVPIDSNSIFKSLDTSENYTILKPRAIRALLLMKFKSISNLEAFREMIFKSGWEFNIKERYLKEIDTLQRILLKTL